MSSHPLRATTATAIAAGGTATTICTTCRRGAARIRTDTTMVTTGRMSASRMATAQAITAATATLAGMASTAGIASMAAARQAALRAPIWVRLAGRISFPEWAAQMSPGWEPPTSPKASTAAWVAPTSAGGLRIALGSSASRKGFTSAERVTTAPHFPVAAKGPRFASLRDLTAPFKGYFNRTPGAPVQQYRDVPHLWGRVEADRWEVSTMSRAQARTCLRFRAALAS